MGQDGPSGVVALLALDDTDTRQGGCTTHVAYQAACAIETAGGALHDWGLVAPARLVRLSPAIREKTRGNGALVLPIGPVHPSAPRRVVGSMPDRTPLTLGAPDTHGAGTAGLTDAVVMALRRLLEDLLPGAAPASADPQPAALLLHDAPPVALYQRAVASRVALGDAWAVAPSGTTNLTPAGRRGAIGALAAAAFQPTPETMTWEAIGYRRGSAAARDLPPDPAKILSGIPGGFDNVDSETGRIRAVPRTPCPVRFGIRGIDPTSLARCATALDAHGDGTGWWLVATNHARGDHLRYATRSLGPERVVRLDVTVTADPQRRRGGHVFVDAVHADDRPVRLAAYEPTKAFAATVMRLAPGDRLVAFGRTAEQPDLVALEAVQVVEQAMRQTPGPNPRCMSCAVAMKSRGRDAGYRCRHCGTTAAQHVRPVVSWQDPALPAGSWHQVPDHVRGHLLPPLTPLPPAQPLRPLAPESAIAR